MTIRLGDVLVQAGVINADQRDTILDEQRTLGRPFGELAERLFDVSPDAIERAWATQYAMICGLVDPRIEKVEDEAVALVTPRQAWQFHVLPLRFDGEEVVLCTTQEDLPRALRFASKVMEMPSYLVISEPVALGEALCKFRHMDGMTPDQIGAPLRMTGS